MNLSILPVAAAGLLLCPLALAQHEQWIPIQDLAPPGTPAELVVDEAASSAQRTVFDLYVHGFWRTDVVGADGKAYARLDFPGLGELGVVGAPELPALRPRVAVATDASSVTRVGAVDHPAGVLSFPMTVFPAPVPALDGEFGSVPEQFAKDEVLYSATAAYPADEATGVAPIGLRFGSIPNATVELFPARYDAAAGELLVAPHLRVAYDHVGAVQAFAPITKDRALQCQAAFPNWPSTGPSFAGNTVEFEGRYLIVTPEKYLTVLEPFIAYRKATGFQVVVRTLEELPFVTCGELRALIADWYAAGDAQFDHYLLLVGDVYDIPLCPSPNVAQVLGDDLYGSPTGLGDLDEEIYVGRLSVDGGGDLKDQIEKIIAYETDASLSVDYGDVLLVAHNEQDPGYYAQAHDAVANASYAVQPTFQKVYGTQLGDDNDDVEAALEDGVGLVAYRGHGGRNTWSQWDWLNESWTVSDVGALTNAQLPVAWSFSCMNQAIDSTQDSIGEVWLEAGSGAVAHYGAWGESGTYKNHVLDAAMFQAVYDLGLTTHAQAIEYAEAMMKAAYPDDGYQNEWMYFLLGDPAMKIRRGAAWQYGVITSPTLPATGATGAGTFTAQVLDPATGGPAAGVLVSAYKAGPDGADEVLANAYTDESGLVVLPSPKTLGDVMLSVRDLEGNVTLTTIPAQAGAFVDLGDALAGTAGEPRLASDSTLLPGAELALAIDGGLPDAIGALAVGTSDVPTALFGGVVHPFPLTTLVPLTLDGSGAWELSIPAWPGVPSGAELVLQAALLDAGAPQGVALTNALLAVAP